MPREQVRERAEGRRAPVPLASLVFLFSAACLAVGAGTAHAWGQVAFLAGGGAWLLVRPPTRSPNRLFNAGCLGLVLWTLLQLLPATAPESPWREALHWAGLLETPSRAAISVPGQLMGLVWLVALFGWLVVALELNARLERSQRRLLLGCFALLMAVLGLTCFVMNSAGVRYPLVPDAHVFSFLPNRNHTALLCALGGVVSFALGFDRIHRNRRRGLLFLGCTLLAFLGVLSLTSRAALLLFLLGMVLCVLTAFPRRRLASRLKLVVPFGVLLLTILLVAGQVTAGRFGRMEPVADLSDGGMSRLYIYRDVFSMLPSVFWGGSGWGSFATVFPYYREASMSFMAVLHPESDWLLFWTEGGLIGLLLVLLILAGLAGAILRSEERPDRFLRIPALVLLLALVHGFVDVPLHNAAVFAFLAWLAGLAPGGVPAAAPRALWLPPVVWRGLGACLLVVSGLWGWGAATGQPWSRPVVEQQSLALLKAPMVTPGDSAKWLQRASGWQPFIWTVHTSRARQALHSGDGEAAELAFRRARAAQVDQGVVTWTEANLWRGLASGRRLSALRSTFSERGIFDREEKFVRLLEEARTDPRLLAGLARISREDTALRERLFAAREHAVIAREVEYELQHHPRLERFPRTRRAPLLQGFAVHVGWERMAAHFDAFPTLKEAYPLAAALAQCEREGWADGGKALRDRLPEPEMTRYAHDASRAQLAASHRRSPEDVAVALAYLRELVKNRDWEAIAELTGTFRPPRGVEFPPSMHYWGARSRYELFLGAEAAPWWRAYLRNYPEARRAR